MEKLLTNEQQIEVLEIAKNSINSHGMLHRYGVCEGISRGLGVKGISFLGYEVSSKYIPLLTIENALIAAREKGFREPKTTGIYWWRKDNKKVRNLFIDWMIEQLKK